MSMNDPLGDLWPHPQRQMRNKSKVSVPTRDCARAARMLKPKLYPRLRVVEREGYSEIEIELKYFEASRDPRDRADFQAGAGLHLGGICRASTTSRCRIVSTPRCHADHDARDANVGGEICARCF